jgi:PIF1-like helicase
MADVHPVFDRLPFGGKFILCGGDWRQILPVVPRARPADIVKASLKSSYLWQHFHVLHLHENMRIAAVTAPKHNIGWLMDCVMAKSPG